MMQKKSIDTISKKEIVEFRKKIRSFYRKHKRILPFRNISDPYKITVSELMLQQTQVDRVVSYYGKWIRHFPDWKQLHLASQTDILAAWSGLGYNRRALYLKKIADIITNAYSGKFPEEVDELVKLPGIGKYTANAIAVFAFKKRVAAVDTNIKKVLLSSFDLPSDLPDSVIQKLAELVLPDRNLKDWHYALMDYAKSLPKSVHDRYAPRYKQSKFEGSIRQIRGFILKELTAGKSVTKTTIARSLNRANDDVSKAVIELQNEGFITISKNKLLIKN
ncbi:MAG: hypothetical protein DWP97_10405 [Calditrichaeota bacterium]|nr:MAG: hypothetical protein DWP97_10405 [Calditrichota bacterium]